MASSPNIARENLNRSCRGKVAGSLGRSLPPNLNLNKIIIPVTHKWQPTLSPNLIDDGDPMVETLQVQSLRDITY